jgi:parafibromin
MAADPQAADPLLLLRHAISSSAPPIPTTSAEATTAPDTELKLSQATHLYFPTSSQSLLLNTPTRFISSNNALDLRSIYFAWLTKDDPVPEYIAATQKLNDELAAPGGPGGKVQNLLFIEKLDLITWLEGASDESEFIKGLPSAAPAVADASAQPAAAGQPGMTRPVRQLDPRLAAIYAGERRMSDMNSILRGIKPTVSTLIIGRLTGRISHMYGKWQKHSWESQRDGLVLLLVSHKTLR